jgi:subfamily B ATP-binding cassette protein MsbA
MEKDNLKQKNVWAIVHRVFKAYIKPYGGNLSVAIFWMVIAASMTGVFAWIIGPVMDEIMVKGNKDMILPIAGILFVCLCMRGISTYFHTVKMGIIGHSLVADIQGDLFKHMIKLDLQYFQDNHSGSLVARVISDVQVMRTALSDSLTGIGKNLITLIILVGVMFARDWVLAIAAFTIFPLAAYYVARLGKKMRSISTRTQDAIGGMSSGLSQTFQAIRQVRAFGREKFEASRSQVTLDRVKDLNIKNTKTSNLSTPVNDVLVGIILFGVIFYGGHQVANGAASAGDIMSFIAAFLMAYEPMKKLAKLNNHLNVGIGAADRVFDVMDTPLGIEKAKRLPKFKAKKSMDIVFDDVSFAYDNGETVLDHVSLTAQAGKVTALIGPSGGGKTTILNLIPRFYDVMDGQVLVNGQDVSKVSLSSLRDHIAWVSQDIVIFDDSVTANIAYGMDGASEKEIIKAAKSAFAHDFIMGLPNGYDTQLGEDGTSLSGGQRQRIALARAFLRNAPILLLDEATSALDNDSERFIQDSLEKLQKGRTTLVIAHRLSTIEKADHIIVLDKGQIVEEGTHVSLSRKKNGLYKQLKNATHA